MKDDLRRLVDEFLKETENMRLEKKDLQLNSSMPEKYKYVVRDATFMDFINWLNEDK